MTEPLTLAQPVWPLNGYAPGGYTCICCTCEEHFDGDKRATTCLECAVTRLRADNKALTENVQELENDLRIGMANFDAATAKLAKVEAERDELSVKHSGAVERALSILAAKNHWHDKFRVVEAELAQANKCIESLNICIKQDDEREADLSAELAEAWKQLELAAAALDEASDEVGDWGAYAGGYFQNKHDLDGCIGEIANQAASIRSFLASKEASQ